MQNLEKTEGWFSCVVFLELNVRLAAVRKTETSESYSV